MPRHKYSILADEDTFNNIRFATRVYLRLHGMSAHTLAMKIGATQPTVRNWCEVDKPSVLTRLRFERLMQILMQEGLVTSDGKHTEKAMHIALCLEEKGVLCDTKESQRKSKERRHG